MMRRKKHFTTSAFQAGSSFTPDANPLLRYVIASRTHEQRTAS
jgi:hypothetical protein